MNTILSNPIPIDLEKNPVSKKGYSKKDFEVEFLLGVIFIIAIGIAFYNVYWWVLTR